MLLAETLILFVVSSAGRLTHATMCVDDEAEAVREISDRSKHHLACSRKDQHSEIPTWDHSSGAVAQQHIRKELT